MLFSKNGDRDLELIKRAVSQVSFFTVSGGALGIFAGGSIGLLKGIPLKKILPSTTFKSAAFFGTISALQNALELGRGRNDFWNPLIAGGWTGFIFGHGLYRNFRIGLALGINAALINLAVQSFTIPRSFGYLTAISESLNPVLLEENSGPLRERIDSLKAEIEKLRLVSKSK